MRNEGRQKYGGIGREGVEERLIEGLTEREIGRETDWQAHKQIPSFPTHPDPPPHTLNTFTQHTHSTQTLNTLTQHRHTTHTLIHTRTQHTHSTHSYTHTPTHTQHTHSNILAFLTLYVEVLCTLRAAGARERESSCVLNLSGLSTSDTIPENHGFGGRIYTD